MSEAGKAAFFESICYQVSVGLVIFDLEQRVCFWNHWLEEKTHIDRKQATGKTLAELFPAFKNPRFDWALREVLRNRSPQVLSQALNSYLIPVPLAESNSYGIKFMQQQIQIIPVEDQDKNIFALVSVVDVTDNVIRAALLSDMAHKLESDSNHDELTGLFNRRFLWEWISQQMREAKRQDFPISCLLFDLDHFKKINDTYGHDVGDKVLVTFANLLVQELRECDLKVRFGGEEFVALLPHIALSDGVFVANRIRQHLSEKRLPFLKETPLTCSIGVSCWDLDKPISGQALLKQADIQLYQAKQSGRNCVYPQITLEKELKSLNTPGVHR